MDHEAAAQYCDERMKQIDAELAKEQAALENNYRLQEQYAGREEYLSKLKENASASREKIEKLEEEHKKYELVKHQIWQDKNGDGAREREHTKEQEQKEEKKKEKENEHEKINKVSTQQREEQLRDAWERER